MAGAIDLTLYGIAVFISPVAVYFKKGVGVQFWVNCCLYCLMGLPGIIHAFYIIHTTKEQGESPQQTQPYFQTTQRRSGSLPSLPHSFRYRPQASFAPYEDHPPPVPPKREEPPLPYDPALHPNSANRPIGRAKSVLHTYRIPQTTLHPAPLRRSRRSNPSPNASGQQPEPDPQPQPTPETRASSSTLHPDPNAPLPYPAEYHPNSAGADISRAKGVLHTYQIPETAFPPRTEEEIPANEPAPERSKSTGSMKGSSWSLRRKGKGLSSLDVNSPTDVPKPDSAGHKSKWSASGPSWLRRRRGREDLQNGGLGTDDEEPATMTMIWDDNFEALRPRSRNLKQAKTHERTESEPVSLSFPAPPGAIRPVIDRTGTSNTALLRPHIRRDSALEAVAEDEPMPQHTVSEGEGPGKNTSPTQDQWHAETDTELGRSKSRLISRLGRRRPHLDTVVDNTPLTSSTSAPAGIKSPQSPNLPRHITPPAVLASTIDEPRTGFLRRGRTLSDTTAANSNSSPLSNESFRNDPAFTIGEYGLGRSGDAYSAATRALHSQERSSSISPRRGLPSPVAGSKRLSIGTALSQTPMATSVSVPAMRRDWTQGTFGTGNMSGSSEGDTRTTSRRSKSEGALPQHQEPEERSQDEEIEEWIRQEDERRRVSATNSQASTPDDHSEPFRHGVTPATASIFSAETSGFAGIGVGTAHEKGRAGVMELWNQPNWDGSNPSIGRPATHGRISSQQRGYPYSPPTETHDNPFKDPAPDTPPPPPPSADTHSSYATGQESFPSASAPISPPISPNRPPRPTRTPPAVPGTEQKPTKPIPSRMPTFGTSSPEPHATKSLSAEGSNKPVVQVLPATPPVSPPRPPASSSKPPPIPARPGSLPPRPQSPKLPPKPAVLRFRFLCVCFLFFTRCPHAVIFPRLDPFCQGQNLNTFLYA
ncbi:hypothetical protein OPQ81_003467 [Rhizoctonia solani]|nr:hypothetical protein OPQ81_003467 [Rhizoctonia solani]